MKGKLPVRSLYTTQLILSVKALKQKTLAIDSSSGIMLHQKLARLAAQSLGLVLVPHVFWAPVGVFFGCVLLIPFFGLFMCPFAIAGLGFKYFVASSSLILGPPLRKPLHNAFKREVIFRLHSS